MKLSIPGLPGVSYNTDARSTALSVVLTAAGRRAPKPQGYALQALPQLLSLEMDLSEVPEDHPFHHLHPTGAQSLEARARQQGQGPVLESVGRELDRALLFAWAVDVETQAGLNRLIDSILAADLEGAVESQYGGSDYDSEYGHGFDAVEPIVIDVEDDFGSSWEPSPAQDEYDLGPQDFEPDDLDSES